MPNRIPLVAAAAAATLFLTACGDGGSDNGPPLDSIRPIPSSNVDPEGIYVGTLHSDVENTTSTVEGAITIDGEVQIVNATNGYQYSGQLSTSGSAGSASGTLTIYDTTEVPAGTTTLSGTVTPGSQITGTYTSSSGDHGEVSLSYSTLYNTGYPFSTLAGSYQWTSTRNGGTASVTATSTGVVSGTTEYGCSFTGQLSIIATIHDLYRASVTTASSTACGAAQNSTLNGLAFYVPPTNGAPATLDVAVNNAAASYYANFARSP